MSHSRMLAWVDEGGTMQRRVGPHQWACAIAVLLLLGLVPACGDDAQTTTSHLGRLTCSGEWNAYSGAGSVVNGDTFSWSDVVITIRSIEPSGDDYEFVGEPLQVIEIDTLDPGETMEWTNTLPWGYRVEAMSPSGPAECVMFAPGD